MASPQPASDAPLFTESNAALTSILERFRRNDLSLEEALSLFEDGVGHIKVCQSHLKQSRGRVEELVNSLQQDGTQATRPFATEYDSDLEEEDGESTDVGDEDDEDSVTIAPETQRSRLILEAQIDPEQMGPNDEALGPAGLAETLQTLAQELSLDEDATLTIASAETRSGKKPQGAPETTLTLISNTSVLTLQWWPESTLLSLTMLSSTALDADTVVQQIDATYPTLLMDYWEI